MEEHLSPSDLTRYLDLPVAAVMKAIHLGELPAARSEDGRFSIALEDAIVFASARGMNVYALMRLRKKRVLVVDDDEVFAEMLEDILSGDIRIWSRRADSLLDAKAKLGEFKPHLVFLDVGLPDGSGTELLDGISSKCSPPPVVIGMSALPTGAVVDEMTRKGASGFMAKPVDPEELLACVRRHLFGE